MLLLLLAHSGRVLKLRVVELGRGLDQLHGDDQVVILLVVDLHVARALRVMHEGALDEGHLHGRVFHVLLP